MKYRAFLAMTLTIIMVGALTAGCSGLKSAPAGDGDQMKYQVITAGDTKDRLDVLKVATARAGDLAKASVELQNDSNFSYTFEYRFKWYDAAGMELNPDSTGWTPVAVMAHETKSLQALAPNPTAATFKLFLQEKP